MKPDLEQDAADLFITLRCGGELLPMGEGIDLLETRLRAAYDAGVERAAEIASAWMNERGYESVAIIEVVERIRAAKEADHG